MFWLIKRFSNNWIALWSLIFIACNPILIGISQIINPDSLLWSFSFIAILSYINLLKTNERKFLILTTLFTGVSLITKYTATILPALYCLIFFMDLLLRDFKGINIKKHLQKQAAHYGIILLGTGLTATLLMPAIIIKPIYLYRLTLGMKMMPLIISLIIGLFIMLIMDAQFFKSYGLSGLRNFFRKNHWLFKIFPLFLLFIFLILLFARRFYSKWTLFDTIPFDFKKFSYILPPNTPNLLEKFLIEFNPLLFSLNPILIILILGLLIQLMLRKENYPAWLQALLIFIPIYYWSLILSDVLTTIRYSIIIYPIIALLGAFSLWLFLEKNKMAFSKPLTSLLIFLFCIVSVISVKPFYFNYTNSLLPKDKLITDAWGYGGYEAAEYLNHLPQAENLRIWSDYYGVCEFFKGSCIANKKKIKEDVNFDYYVLTRRGELRLEPVIPEEGYKFIDPSPYYSKPSPTWELNIDNRPENFIKILKVQP